MKKAVCGALVATQLLAVRFALAQTNLLPPHETSPWAGASQPGPVLAVSPSLLQFGLVGVGRTKDLTLTVQNVGGGQLAGTATVAAPFAIADNDYSLRGGQSKLLRVRYGPTAQGTNSQSIVFSGRCAATVPVAGVALTPPPPPGKPRIISPNPSRFAEADAADFIARYYSDDTSYALKPAMMDGAFRSVCDRAFLLKLAGQQPRRDLAVVVLVHYPGARQEDPIKAAWVNDLKGLGYQRIVFLRAENSMKVNGLPLLEYPQASLISAGK